VNEITQEIEKHHRIMSNNSNFNFTTTTIVKNKSPQRSFILSYILACTQKIKADSKKAIFAFQIIRA
jgi:hypothetical protein